MQIVYSDTNYQDCQVALFHHGYLQVVPADVHFGYQFTRESAEAFIVALQALLDDPEGI